MTQLALVNEEELQELVAWKWLRGIPRLDYRQHDYRRMDRQIQIWMMPPSGEGQAGVLVSVDHPKHPQRIKGRGNTLFEACCKASARLTDAGVPNEYPETMLVKERHERRMLMP